MGEKKYYKVYGLEIESELKFDIPEFIKVEGIKNNNKKIVFKYGSTPEMVKEMHKKGEFVSISENELYLHIEKVATYFISNGNTVSVDMFKNSDENMVKIYLLGSVLGILLVQRKELAIHGAVVSNKNKTIIVTGDKGVGKSTLTTAFRIKGYSYLSDDVAAISFLDKIPLIEPGFPYQKICEDMMETLKYDKKDYQYFTTDQKNKYLVSDINRFITEKAKLNAICQITIGNIDNVILKEVVGFEKLNLITKNIFRKEYINACGGMSKDYFKQCINVANNVKVYNLIRPYRGYTVEEQMKAIEEKIFCLNS